MIITHLMGGLGNQMFEYAAGLALARRRRTVLKLDISFYKEHDIDDRHYSLDCLNVPAQFATDEEVWRLKGKVSRVERIAATVFDKLRMRRFSEILKPRGVTHNQTQWAYYPEFAELPDNTWLGGNYQSERFFLPVADILRHQFTFRYPPTPRVDAMVKEIQSGVSVAMHFRRGDYLNKYSGIGALSLEFYEKAMILMQSKLSVKPKCFIFSDDIEAVEREYRPDFPHVFVKCVDHSNYYDKIRLMSICDHNIIANSTFSWWAAWLNPNPAKIVIAPKKWYSDDHNPTHDLFPPEWFTL